MKSALSLFTLILLGVTGIVACGRGLTPFTLGLSFTPFSGAPGTVVTFTGADFSSVSRVTLSGVSSLILNQSSSQMQVYLMPESAPGGGRFLITRSTSQLTTNESFAFTSTLYPVTQMGSKRSGTGNVGAAFQGKAVAISADGTVMVEGGYQDNTTQGAVWVFTRSGTSWSQYGLKLTPSDNVGAAAFGSTVAISADGNTIMVGGGSDNTNIGAAWIFVRSNGSWSQQGSKLVGTGNVGAGNQGSVALSPDGNTALIGAPNDNAGVGAFWVFTRSGSTWTQQGSKYTGTSQIGVASVGSPIALSADATTIAASGVQDNSYYGAVWIFSKTSTGYSQQAKLIGSNAIAPPVNEGQSVSLSANGNTVAFGGDTDNSSIGAVWVFTRSGGVWTEQAKIVPTDYIGTPFFGESVSLSADGNVLWIGGQGDNSNIGANWVYKRTNGVWSQVGTRMIGTGVTASAFQGTSVSMTPNGTYGVSGARGDNGNQGAFWVFGQ